MTDPSTHLFWITSRAAGTTALVLASASVSFGVVMGGRLRQGGGSERLSIHQTLALATLVAVAIHGLSLIGDQYLHPSLLDVTVPFVLSYKTIPTSIGILAGWALALLGLSYYARRWIGHQRWKAIHRFTLLAWAAALVHTFTEGTDAGQLWFVALIAVTAAPAIALLPARIIAPAVRSATQRSTREWHGSRRRGAVASR